MLGACHDRVRRSLALLERLIEHLDRVGHDLQSRGAARDVLRYFELAAPLHHEDEERHVFPRLLAFADPVLGDAVRRLRAEHERMALLWRSLRGPLDRWTRPDSAGPAEPALRTQAQAFVALYREHLPLEESLVFPAARSLAGPDELAAIGAEMQSRRRRR